MGSRVMISTWLRVRTPRLQAYLETYGGLADKFCLVRTTRARIIRLRNDHKGLMLKCEEGLHAFHASMRDASPETVARFRLQAAAPDPPQASSSGVHQAPFAKVDNVVTGSPAEEAGLKVGDLIRSFGAVDGRNHEKLSKVAELVGKSEGVRNVHPLKDGAVANEYSVAANHHRENHSYQIGQSAARGGSNSIKTPS